MSIQAQVTKYVVDHDNCTLDDVKKEFSDYNSKTLSSAFRRATKDAGITASSAKINMDMVEKLLMKELRKKPGPQILRLIIDFLKIKSQDHSELEEIDLNKFYKKAMED